MSPGRKWTPRRASMNAVNDRPAGTKFGNNSGLGLSIVRQITDTHRGTVWAENRMTDGRIAGARFVVELPVAQLSI